MRKSTATVFSQTYLPIVHTVIGKVSFANNKLEENYQALIKSIGKEKIKSIFINFPDLTIGVF